jgi:hypothetical protein
MTGGASFRLSPGGGLDVIFLSGWIHFMSSGMKEYKLPIQGVKVKSHLCKEHFFPA